MHLNKNTFEKDLLKKKLGKQRGIIHSLERIYTHFKVAYLQVLAHTIPIMQRKYIIKGKFISDSFVLFV